MSTVLELQGVTKEYPGGTRALAGVDLAVQRGELVGIVGPSGSGKSTLLHVMGTLDRPSAGNVLIDGEDVSGLDDDALAAVRAHHIGFIFQRFFLIPGLSAGENVAEGLLYSGVGRAERRRAAEIALERVGLSARINHRAESLSGGERQRVAIARALLGDPAIVFADEPTGNLDSVSGGAVVDLLRSINADGRTVCIITHDRELAASLPRRVTVRDGLVESDEGGGR